MTRFEVQLIKASSSEFSLTSGLHPLLATEG